MTVILKCGTTMVRRCGQSLVEFALVFPIFILLAFAIIDFGRAFYQYSIMNEACRVAVREAAVMTFDEDVIAQYIKDRVVQLTNERRFGQLTVTNDQVTVNIPERQAIGSEPITVRVTASFNAISGGFLPAIRNAFLVTAAASSWYEYPGEAHAAQLVYDDPEPEVPVEPVEVPDSDGDGVPDNEDEFPDDATENNDNDDDGIGDNADTDDDNDGLTDQWETQNGTSPWSWDSDGDGLSDSAEIRNGTNPNSRDTDGDGLKDSKDPDPTKANDSDGDGQLDGYDYYPNDPTRWTSPPPTPE